MGTYNPTMGGMILAFWFGVIADGSIPTNLDPQLRLIVVGGVAAIGAVIGWAAWEYSPIPDTNGGWGLPPARWQKWGWTNEPRYDDYKEPTTEEVMSAAVPWGWSFADRETEAED